MLLPALFALTLLVSSFLLFLIQPMIAKMVLPLLGGTPAVWNTCMVFFQATLLAGYTYAHALTARLGARRQALLHLGVLLLPFLVLPIGVARGWTPPDTSTPIFWLLALLTASVGLPFFVASTHAPLLQKWFAATGHSAGHDPYFLYAASNLGSMVALLSYPFLVEPLFTLRMQSWLWTVGYGLLVLLMAACAAVLWRQPRKGHPRKDTGAAKEEKVTPPLFEKDEAPPLTPSPPSARTRLRWVALAFVPSSLMLSVTTYLTTDLAAIPLLWVVPLSVYLLTFILVFARRPLLPHAWMVRLLPGVMLLLTLVLLSEATALEGLSVWPLLALHLLGLFVGAMVCHGELARQRPPVQYLTEFYLWLSLGGVLGGLFNSLVAPLIFSSVVEYPLVLVLACLLRPGDRDAQERRLDWIWPAILGAVTFGLVLGVQATGVAAGPTSFGLMFAGPAVLCYTFLHRPIRFGLGIGALLLAGAFYHGVHGQLEYRTRSFFGVHRVTRDPTGNFHQLIHGNTVHGQQRLPSEPRTTALFLAPLASSSPFDAVAATTVAHHFVRERLDEPLAYYHRTGPIGQIFSVFSGAAAKPHVAVVGLGAGSLAAYGEPGQEFTYFEIDPTVERIARDDRYFTFLRDSRARVRVVLGDARLTLRDAPDGQFGLLFLDAFSSDAIPLHLLTREALHLYLQKLAKGGLLVFHISNRYLDLKPVLGDLARDANLVVRIDEDMNVSAKETSEGKSASLWVVMARQVEDLGKLARSGFWEPIRSRGSRDVWTDDYSNLFRVFKWN
jgi:SAM-dependent methyltransferase